MLDVSQNSEYASDLTFKYKIGKIYFKFLHDSRMIYLPLNISEKFHWQHLVEKLGEA